MVDTLYYIIYKYKEKQGVISTPFKAGVLVLTPDYSNIVVSYNHSKVHSVGQVLYYISTTRCEPLFQEHQTIAIQR